MDPKQNYRVVDKDKYYRKGVFEHFSQGAKCSISMTGRIDVTDLVAYSKKTGTKFYLNFLYLLSKVMNSRDDYKMGYLWKSEELICYDQVNPTQYVFHEDTETCSPVYSIYDSDYQAFYEAAEKDVAEAKKTREYQVDEVNHPNWFDASYLSWESYDSFSVELPDGYLYFPPIVNWGRNREENGRLMMPLSVRMNHAIADGYLVSLVYKLLAQEIKTFVETTPEQKRLAKELQTIAAFWDGAFKEGQPSPLTAADFQPSQKLNQDIFSYGKRAHKALDFGAGVDLLFLEAALEGAAFEGLNLDPSEAATKLHQGYIDLSKVTTLHCQQGGLEGLSALPDGSFDLIVISNVIDVLPEEETGRIVNAVKRLLAPQGIFLLKTNFYLDDEMIQKRGMHLTDGKLYVDGVLRAVNRTDESWIAQFGPLTLIDSYPYERILNGPKDRCFVFQNLPFVGI